MKIYNVVALQNICELADGVEKQFGLAPGTVDINALFTHYPINSYQAIYFDDENLHCVQLEMDSALNAEEYQEANLRMLVIVYLRDIFPDEEFVIYSPN